MKKGIKGEPTETEFERLSKKNMPLLLEWMDSLQPEELTFAAEIAGKNATLKNSKLVINKLMSLLSHESPLVREGAILGLGNHINSSIKRKLADMANFDPSKAIRITAKTIMTYGRRL